MKKHHIGLICLSLGLALPLPAFAEEPAKATATFVNEEGAETGSATLTATGDGVLIVLELGDLPPDQWLGFHVHETGSCDAAGGHAAAGGHFNPTGAAHGYLAEGGPHAGDMPNIRSDSEGFARVAVLNTLVALGEGESSIKGRALMVHAAPDDYRSQPSGEAGARLACAGIE